MTRKTQAKTNKKKKPYLTSENKAAICFVCGVSATLFSVFGVGIIDKISCSNAKGDNMGCGIVGLFGVTIPLFFLGVILSITGLIWMYQSHKNSANKRKNSPSKAQKN